MSNEIIPLIEKALIKFQGPHERFVSFEAHPEVIADIWNEMNVQRILPIDPRPGDGVHLHGAAAIPDRFMSLDRIRMKFTSKPDTVRWKTIRLPSIPMPV